MFHIITETRSQQQQWQQQQEGCFRACEVWNEQGSACRDLVSNWQHPAANHSKDIMMMAPHVKIMIHHHPSSSLVNSTQNKRCFSKNLLLWWMFIKTIKVNKLIINLIASLYYNIWFHSICFQTFFLNKSKLDAWEQTLLKGVDINLCFSFKA